MSMTASKIFGCRWRSYPAESYKLPDRLFAVVLARSKREAAELLGPNETEAGCVWRTNDLCVLPHPAESVRGLLAANPGVVFYHREYSADAWSRDPSPQARRRANEQGARERARTAAAEKRRLEALFVDWSATVDRVLRDALPSLSTSVYTGSGYLGLSRAVRFGDLFEIVVQPDYDAREVLVFRRLTTGCLEASYEEWAPGIGVDLASWLSDMLTASVEEMRAEVVSTQAALDLVCV